MIERWRAQRSFGDGLITAEVVLRLLVLKHIRNWSYDVLEREVRANLVYRDFTRVGGTKMPDAKTMGRWGVALGPATIQQIHERMVQIAREAGVAPGSAPARRRRAACCRLDSGCWSRPPWCRSACAGRVSLGGRDRSSSIGNIWVRPGRHLARCG